MTIREVLSAGTALLATAPVPFPPGEGDTIEKIEKIDTPALDAALLLGSIVQTDRVGLILRGAEPLAEAARQRYIRLLERRLQGECVAWILGYKEFWGLQFAVSPEVLVPRPDTETLVEATLAAIDGFSSAAPCTLLDLCTGSGAVAIALKHERPDTAVYAADIAPEALNVAKGNAARLLPGPGIQCIESDLFDQITGRFHIITANPPYIPSSMIPRLALEVRREPRLSLDGGADGLAVIRRLIGQARGHLYPGGVLFIEADPRQMQNITKILSNHGYKNIATVPDLSNMPRVITAQV
ncbi:MAG: peptide chain release factor N(5)-glutamine methyltransferase [Treponema sp.]|jgi:release factor glutamine methyltransferase|nr:peptide chain release factor N(5)-glutamine methyltransferase [Treponema sp.]